MAISGEWILNKLKQRIYAVSHAKVVVRNKSTVDKDLTSLENRATTMEQNLTTVKQMVNNLDADIQKGIVADGTAIVMLGTANAVGEVTIPTEGWKEDEELGVMYLDVENSAITESTVPVIAVSPQHSDRAAECRMKPYCRTYEGILRIYAESVPTDIMIASIALIGEKSDAVSLDQIPKATATQAGLVKPSSSSFIIDDETGELKVNTDVVVTNDDLVDESEMQDDIKKSLKD